MFLLKKRYWLLITIILTPVLILWRAPASILVYGLQQAAPNLKMSGVAGSLWRGQAANGVWEQGGYEMPLGRLTWQLQGLSLLALSPCVDFSATAQPQAIKGEACYSVLSGTARANEVDVSLPMATISPLLQVDVGGSVDAFIQSVNWDGQGFVDTSMNLLWNRAQINSGREWISLGDLQANANAGENGSLVSRWSSVDTDTGEPPVLVQLDVTLSNFTAAQPAFRVDGLVTPGPQARSLQPMLQFIGERTPSGAYRIFIDE